MLEVGAVYRDTVHLCREKINVAKVQLELKLASTFGDNKSIYIYLIMLREKGGLEKTLVCCLHPPHK